MHFDHFKRCEAGQILKKLLSNTKRLKLMREKVFEVRKTFMWNKEVDGQGVRGNFADLVHVTKVALKIL